MDLTRIKYAVAAFMIILIVIILFKYINYDDLSWAANSSSYMGLITAVLVIVSMIASKLTRP